MSGLATYHGAISSNMQVQQSNHTAEFIYVSTDRSGKEVEYACMFANCFPKSVKESHFDYDAGTHNLVPIEVEFSCVKYESIPINYYAKQLLNKFQILSNHLNFNPHITSGSNSYTGTSITGAGDSPMDFPTDSSKIENVTYNDNTTYDFS